MPLGSLCPPRPVGFEEMLQVALRTALPSRFCRTKNLAIAAGAFSSSGRLSALSAYTAFS